VNRFFVLLLTIAFSFQSCTAQVPAGIPQSVPEFTFYTIKGNQAVSRTSLALKGNIVFVFFDPGCSHCRTDITAMGDNFDKFKNANFYLVSQQNSALVNEFMNTYGKKMQNKPNVHVLLDRNYEFLQKFNPSQYPATYVYGQDRKLKSFHDGARPIAQIIKEVNQ
jgi:peroxiredoxin